MWKLCAALAISAPRLPRLKEWAYAGILFNLGAAAVLHAVIGCAPNKVIAPLALLAIAATSWALRPPSRRLAPPSTPPSDVSFTISRSKRTV
jgi:hypothetical protein